MSIEVYEGLMGRFELYRLIQEGLDDVAAGRTRPMEETFEELRRWLDERHSTQPKS